MPGLLQKELYKIINKKVHILLFLILCLFNVLLYVPKDKVYNKNLEEQYKSYISKYEGQLTQENYLEIQKENERRSKLFDAQEDMFKKHRDKVITDAQYAEYIKQLSEAQRTKEAFDMFYNKIDYIYTWTDKIKDINEEIAKKEKMKNYDYDYYYYKLKVEKLGNIKPSEVYYDSGWNKLFSNPFPDILIAVFLFIVLSPVFTREYESGVDLLILSSAEGKRGIVTAKIIASSIIAVFTYVVFSLINIRFLLNLYEFPGSHTLLQSLPKFGDCLYKYTIKEYFIIFYSLKLFGVLALVFMILFISSAVKNSMVSLFASACVYGMPILVEKWFVSYYDIIDANRLIFREPPQIFGRLIFGYHNYVIFFVLLTIALACATYYFFAQKDRIDFNIFTRVHECKKIKREI